MPVIVGRGNLADDAIAAGGGEFMPDAGWSVIREPAASGNARPGWIGTGTPSTGTRKFTGESLPSSGREGHSRGGR